MTYEITKKDIASVVIPIIVLLGILVLETSDNISKYDQKSRDSFCKDIQTQETKGVFMVNYIQTQTGDGDAKWYCFTETETKWMDITMRSGVQEYSDIKLISKSFLPEIINAMELYGFDVDSEKSSYEDYGEFGTCHQVINITLNLKNELQDAWWLGSTCGTKENPGGISNTPYFTTNMSGMYNSLINYFMSLDENTPLFSEYPVEIWEGTSVTVDFSTDLNFRGQYLKQVPEGPNFAGHYTIVTWGCGTSCRVGSIVDNKTGSILGKILSDGLAGGFEFKIDSNLLITHMNDYNELGNDRIDYYFFENDSFNPIYQKP